MTAKSWLLACALAAFASGVTACKQEGPLEKAGRQVDKAVDKAGDKIDRAADQLQK